MERAPCSSVARPKAVSHVNGVPVISALGRPLPSQPRAPAGVRKGEAQQVHAIGRGALAAALQGGLSGA
ncbi:hypothetical protein [Pseudotabrizicola sp. 4114]|uniref:hypothetical protein n=1 Tax=Pseudotabrizicola sp. 4114 TaxID=2817731 RepID=UPI00285CDF51|nr:hypothetical protein [Pseudorhodobacter sp. 4114]